ncbi:MAG: hypothetical protein K1000chlam3_01421 [Chlamydiae bacterium]|nr:hypothetical protein [Chlamydiota bacterium]
MITKKEIFSKAEKLKLPISTIEKDYVISWILTGIYHYPPFKKTWIFKGGTCLKKCYFGNYRFSEDLDFTISDPKLLNLEQLKEDFTYIADFVEENSGIEIARSTIRFESYKNLNKKISFQGKLNYRGPLQPRTNFPKLKIDLTAEEVLISSPSFKRILHDYSDPIPSVLASCYSIEEMLAEKLRALVERARPRDLYDVIHLFNTTPSANRVILLKTLREKCKYKNVPLPSLKIIKEHPNFGGLKTEWRNMLEHQLPDLKPFSYYWELLSEVLDHIL